MMNTEMTRVAQMSEAERNLVNFLTPDERRDALVAAGRIKQRRNDEQLMRDYLARVKSGDIAPETINPDTDRPYPDNNLTYYYRNDAAPFLNIGRVPGHPGLQVLRKQDNSLIILHWDDLRKAGETWHSVFDLGDDDA